MTAFYRLTTLLVSATLALSAAAEERKDRVLAVEEAMRAVSERHFKMTGSYPSWPARTSDGSALVFPDDGFYGSDLLSEDLTRNIVIQIYNRVYDIARLSLKNDLVAGGSPQALQFVSDDMPPAPTAANYAAVFEQLIPIVRSCGRRYSSFGGYHSYPTHPPSYQAGILDADYLSCAAAIAAIESSYAANQGAAWRPNYWDTGARTETELSSVDIGGGTIISSGRMTTAEGWWKFDSSTIAAGTIIKFFSSVASREFDRVADTLVLSNSPFADFSTIESPASPFLQMRAPRGWPSFIGCTGYPIDKVDTRSLIVYFSYTQTFSSSWDRVWIEPDNCERCRSGCNFNTPTFALHSLDFSLNLGPGPLGSAGFLHLAADVPAQNLGSLSALRRDLRDGTSVFYDRTQPAGSPARQILAPQVFVDLVSLDAYSYEIRFYRPADKGILGSNGLYSPSGTLLGKTKVENLDQSLTTSYQMRITTTNGSDVEKGEFTYTPASQGWLLRHERGGDVKFESRASTINGQGQRVEIHEIRNSSNTVVWSEQNTYEVFPWNAAPNARNLEELVSSVLDPSGVAETTTYAYYTSAGNDGPNYGRLKSRVTPTGYWELCEYDALGRMSKKTSPFGNSTLGSTTNLRIMQTQYDTGGYIRTDTETVVLGDGSVWEVGRTHSLNSYNSPRTVETVVCTVPGASWNAASNLVTTTKYVGFGTFLGRLQSIVRPDGTGELYTYSSTGGNVTTTIYAGAFNAGRTQVVAGRKTIRITNSLDIVIDETVSDIASNLVLSTKIATQFDDAGRVTRYDYQDGSFETYVHGCCGLETQTSRDGVTTAFVYDPWRRVQLQTRDGLSTRFTYDLMGRRTGMYRKGTDNSEMPIETSIYDQAGRLTSVTTHGLRTTTHAQTLDVDGRTVRTATLPDGATRIETLSRDGTIHRLAGTAALPKNYDYGVDAFGPFVREISVGAAGETSEWMKSHRDFAGRPYKTLFPDGAVQQSYFNAMGQLVRTVDPDGVTTLSAYNTQGERKLTAVDMNANNAIDLTGTDRVARTTVLVATKTEASNNYVVERRTTEVWETMSSDSPVVVAVSERTADGLRSWETVRGLTTKRVVARTGGGGRTVTTTAPDGVKTVQAFTADRLLSTIVSTAADVQLASTTLGYDAHRRVSTTTDARNGITTYTYFADDHVHSVTTPDPDNAQSGPGYDPQTTTYAYDNIGRVQTVTQPDATVVNTTYWPTGAVKRTWGARTYPIEYTYDAQGRVKTITTWQNFAGDTGKAVTTWNYDSARGWLLNKRYADNQGPTYTYKPSGRLLTRTWARTPAVTTTYVYNAAGDLATTDYSDSTPDVVVTYDRSGRPGSMSDGVGARALGYHASGQLEDETYTTGALSGVVVDRSFDGLHRLSGVGVPAVTTATYGYDNASRMETVTVGNTTATYAYAANSPLIASVVFKQSGTTRLTTTKTYDALNRLAAISNQPSAAGAAALSYAYRYDSANQRTRATREDNAYWSYGYDALGQVTSGKKFQAGGTPVSGHDFAWTYDDIGNRKTATANAQTTTYTPNTLNQYQQRTVPGVVEVMGAADPAATVTVSVDNGAPQPTTRQGELFHRQVSVTNAAAGQNPALKITGVKNLAGPLGEDVIFEVTRNAFVAQTPEVFVHDLDGNLTADARWTYTWDGENRIVALETSAAAVALGVSRQRLEFAYDGQSRRIAKKVSNWNGATWVLASHTLFVYDGWNMVAELNALSGNAALRTYVWGMDLSGTLQGAGGVGGLLAITNVTASETHVYAYDGNGNVAGLARASDGSVSARYDYNAFGEPILIEGAFAEANGIRFSSKYMDSETGYLYYGFRYYNPQTARWLSRDPIDEFGGMNLYGMLSNSSIANVDFLGLADTKSVLEVFGNLQLGLIKFKCCPRVLRYLTDVNEKLKSSFSKPDVLQAISILNDSIDKLEKATGTIGTNVKIAQGSAQVLGIWNLTGLTTAARLAKISEATEKAGAILKGARDAGSVAALITSPEDEKFSAALRVASRIVGRTTVPIGNFLKFYADAYDASLGAINGLSFEPGLGTFRGKLQFILRYVDSTECDDAESHLGSGYGVNGVSFK
jgi:RHS repeat-associated protein